MKKFMTIVMAAALVFAVAGTASAGTLETSGEARFRLWNLDNYLQDGHSTEFWDQRVRLNLVWPVNDNVKVSLRADILEGFWGDNTQSVQRTYVQDPTTGAISDTETIIGTAPKPPISFDQAYATVKIPDTGATVSLGRQPVTWGLGVAAKADNRDRFKLVYKAGAFTIVYAYDKFKELFAEHDTGPIDDNRGHALGAVTTVGGFNTGLLAYYAMNETSLTVDSTRLLVDGFFMGKAGPATIKGEVAFQTGKNEAKGGGMDVDYEGLMAYLGAFMDAGPATVGIEAAYARGDDPDTTDKVEGSLYHGPFNSIILFNNLDYPGYAGETSGDSSVGNAIAAKVSATMKPMDNVSVTGAAIYATRDQVTAGMDKAMGTEIDLIVVYGVTEAVNVIIGGGYLMAGDYYGDVDNPWGAMVATVVNF